MLWATVLLFGMGYAEMLFNLSPDLSTNKRLENDPTWVGVLVCSLCFFIHSNHRIIYDAYNIFVGGVSLHTIAWLPVIGPENEKKHAFKKKKRNQRMETLLIKPKDKNLTCTVNSKE
jgi:hypothetical protein